DLRPDPYYKRNYSIRSSLIPPGYEESKRINGFQDAARSRFTFFSPDTTFYQPSLSNDGQHLKLEAIMYGHSFGHFVQVKDNAMYKLLTRKQIGLAVAIGAFSGFVFGAGRLGWPHYHIGNIVPNTTQVMELIEKIAPYTNHGYMYT